MQPVTKTSNSPCRKRGLLFRSSVRLIVWCIGITASSLLADDAREAMAAEPPHIAVLPSFTDVGTPDSWRPWAAGFDAALQAELIQGWNVAVTSRSGLSTVVFDQKLALAKGERTEPPQVRAANFSVFLTLDARKLEVRVHVTPVSEGMKIGKPVIHKFRNAKHYSIGLPKEVAKNIARQIGLRPRKDRKLTPPKADSKTAKQAPLKIAIVPPFSTIKPQHFTETMSTLFVAMLEEGCLALKQPVELVERIEIAQLLGERELLAQNATTTAGLDANTAANIARLAGAQIILIPYLHPVTKESARVTIHAIDSDSGEIIAARSWTGKVSEAPPNSPLAGLLNAASRPSQHHAVDLAASRTLRHAEADHLIGLYDTMIHTRASFRERALLSLILADAALALAYDDPDRTGKVISKFFYQAFPWKNRATLAWSDSLFDRRYKRAKADGSLAEIHRQARRVFELPIRELRKTRGNRADSHYQSYFLLVSGDAQAALDQLLALEGGVEAIARQSEFTKTYAMALIELGRTREAVEFLSKRVKHYKSGNLTFFLLLDALRLEGNVQREIELMYRLHKEYLEKYSTARLARFLEIAVHHGRPDWCLQVFYYRAHPWARNELPVIEQLVRLRMALDQKQRAIDSAQCGHLLAILEKKPEFTEVFAKLLDELGAKPLETLPTPASSIKLFDDSRIDLFHDPTIPQERAARIGQLVANFWNCEVHVLAAPLDATKLEGYDHASQRISATDLANHMSPLIRPGDGLLQTVFLTALPIRSSNASIYSITSSDRFLKLVSSYYFDYYFDKKEKKKSSPLTPTLDQRLAIAVVQIGPMSSAISRQLWLNPNKIKRFKRFKPLPPDALANSGTLTLDNRVLGVSPHTARVIAEMPPEAFREGANMWRDRQLKRMANDNSPDVAIFRKISAVLSKTNPVIIKPNF